MKRLLQLALAALLCIGAQMALAANGAAYVNQWPPPFVEAGKPTAIQIMMRNTGTTTWTTGSYFLGSQNPTDNTIWGTSRAVLYSDTAPGSMGSFAVIMTAPATPGVYDFQWRMIQEGVEWFGPQTPNLKLDVAVLQPLLTNGGFESGATTGYQKNPTDQKPWYFGSGAGVTDGAGMAAYPPPPEGRLAAVLKYYQTIRQTGTVATEGNYRISYRLLGADPQDTDGADVIVDGVMVHTSDATSSTEWIPIETPSFHLTAGKHLVELQGWNGAGLYIDDVKLTLQPPVLITNGSFEAGATADNASTATPGDQGPWVFTGTAGVTGKNSTLASGITPTADGRLAAYLQEFGSMSQTGNVAVAGNYSLTFDAVGKSGYQQVKVFVNDDAKWTYNVYASTEWSHIATEIIPLPAGSHKITLAGNSTGSGQVALVDNVRLVPASVFNLTTITGAFEEWQIGAGHIFANIGQQPWTFSDGSGLISAGPPGNWPVFNGKQSAVLFMDGQMSQTWTDVGGTYRIEFAAALANGPATVTVTTGVSPPVTRLSSPISSTSYVTKVTPDFTLPAGTNTVKFSVSGAFLNKVYIDDVKLVNRAPPPPPSTGCVQRFRKHDSSRRADRRHPHQDCRGVVWRRCGRA